VDRGRHDELAVAVEQGGRPFVQRVRREDDGLFLTRHELFRNRCHHALRLSRPSARSPAAAGRASCSPYRNSKWKLVPIFPGLALVAFAFLRIAEPLYLLVFMQFRTQTLHTRVELP